MSRPSPAVTFVVPTYRRPDALRGTLDALLGLDYREAGYEVIVVDDGSGDATAAIIDEFAAKHPLVSGVVLENGGVARARNAGAGRAAGDLLIFLDDDILVEPDHIQRHLAAREIHGDCLVNGHWEFAPHVRRALQSTPFGRYRLEVERWVKTGIAKEPTADGRLLPSAVTACNLSISRRMFETIGGFDETFPFAGCEDQDFSLRATRLGATVVYDPSIRLLHNDERVTLEQFCARQRRGALSAVFLVARHPEEFASRSLFMENTPDSRFDPPRLRVKKALKAIYSSRAGLLGASVACRVLERVAPESRALGRIYSMTIGAHIFMGIRQGVAQLPQARAAAEHAAASRDGAG